MRMRVLGTASFLAFLSIQACKQGAPEGASDLNADAKAVSSGEEVLLTRDSQPAPVMSPKASKEDLNPELFNLQDKSFPRLEVGEHQIAGSDLTGTPRALQGIWWMDGNPFSDETVSFAKVDFEQEFPKIPVFSGNNFSFHADEGTSLQSGEQGSEDKSGYNAFQMVKDFSLIYEFHFEKGGKDYTRGYIAPTLELKVGPLKKRLRVSKQLIEFTFIQRSEHIYERGVNALTRPTKFGYTFRRILIPSANDPKVLEKTEWWDLYAKQNGPKAMRLPVR